MTALRTGYPVWCLCLQQAGSGCYSFQGPRSRTPSSVSDIWGHALLAHTPEVGLRCYYPCCLLVPGLCCEPLQESGSP